MQILVEAVSSTHLKKVMLFIVEGPTDETSLSTVLNRIFSSATVNFQVIHGDILTRDFTSSDKIVVAVWAQRCV